MLIFLVWLEKKRKLLQCIYWFLTPCWLVLPLSSYKSITETNHPKTHIVHFTHICSGIWCTKIPNFCLNCTSKKSSQTLNKQTRNIIIYFVITVLLTTSVFWIATKIEKVAMAVTQWWWPLIEWQQRSEGSREWGFQSEPK